MFDKIRSIFVFKSRFVHKLKNFTKNDLLYFNQNNIYFQSNSAAYLEALKILP